MGWSDNVVTEYFEPEDFIPAIAQGALGIEVRSDDQALIDMLLAVHSEETALCTNAERTFLKRMDGSCQVPYGVYESLADGELYLNGIIMSVADNERYDYKKSHEDT